MDREKVIKGLEICVSRVPGEYGCAKCPYEGCGNDCEIQLIKDAIALLKEQEKKKSFVYSDGKITPLPDVVRCKDCVYRGNEKRCIIAFIADKQDFPFFFYDNHGEWFCADGSRKDGEANEHGRGKADEH